MRLLIIEDEAPAARRIKKLVIQIDPDIEVLALLDSIEATVEWFGQNPQPDLILMDIELADGQSFEIFNRVKITAPVIFTTAYDEFALKAFKVNSIDYLLKPIEPEALAKSLNKLQVMKKQLGATTANYNIDALLKNLAVTQSYKSRFLAKLGDRLISIEKEHIAYFMSEDKVTFLVTQDNKKYILDQTLDELEKQTDPKFFFRINRQFIASLKAIGSIHNYFNGKLKLSLNPPVKEEVLVSREKASLFKEWLDS